MSDVIVQCETLSKSFTDGKLNVDVLRGVDLSVQNGEMLAIIGSSGSGKSTLLHLLGGLDKPSSGSVIVNDTKVHELSARKCGDFRNKYLGFIYQFHHLLTEFNALENVCMPLLIRGTNQDEAKSKSLEMLKAVGLEHRVAHRIGELSGGERQRVAIARALVTDPLCVFADEPTGNLDNKTAEHVFDIMLELQSKLNTTFIVVTHDMHLAERMDRQLTLENGVLT